MEDNMQTENQNIIFTVFNRILMYILGILEVINIIVVLLAFTIVKPEYIVFYIPCVLLVCIIPIFMYGMRYKIIYRFTKDEFQYRGKNPYRTNWKNILSFNIDEENINLSLKDKTTKSFPILQFNKEDLQKALTMYIENSSK